MTRIAVPPVYADYTNPDLAKFGDRTVFLAGPIQGSTEWQTEAAKLLTTNTYDYTIANPRRSDSTWEFQFDQQVDWEVHHLDKAAENGVVIFYLAKEAQHDCGRSYAQTTRFELGWFMAMHQAGLCKNLVICFEEGFTGARYIQRRLATHAAFADVEVTEHFKLACAVAKVMLTEGR